MGQKDYQQCLVVQQLIEILGIRLEFHKVPTVREADGLAQSSRNRRLTADERKNAPAISMALKMIREKLAPGDTRSIVQMAEKKLDEAHFRTDYVAISNAGTFHPFRIGTEKKKPLH